MTGRFANRAKWLQHEGLSIPYTADWEQAFSSLILDNLQGAERYLLQALPHQPGLSAAERIPLLGKDSIST